MKKAQSLRDLSKGMKVLLVEDEKRILEAYVELMSEFFEVDTATNGVEALNKIDTNNYEIIFTDINMPKMNGIELCELVKHNNPNQKVIVITAYSDKDNIIKLLELNVDKLLQKPVREDMFIYAVYDVVSAVYTQRKMENTLKFQEKALVESAKLAQMGEMLSMIAHQWRQPLTTISMVLNTVKVKIDLQKYSDNPSLLENDFIEAQEKAEESINYLSETIEDFRNFFKKDKTKKTFNIADSIRTCVGMIPLDNIEVKLDLQDHEIFSFKREFQQVIINIIANAKEQLSSIDMVKGVINITSSADDEKVIIEICDNGGGIPDYAIKPLFKPYFSTKGKNGTGLGLYMSKTIIDTHMNGLLTATNKNNGACFTIELPLKNKGNTPSNLTSFN